MKYHPKIFIPESDARLDYPMARTNETEKEYILFEWRDFETDPPEIQTRVIVMNRYSEIDAVFIANKREMKYIKTKYTKWLPLPK